MEGRLSGAMVLGKLQVPGHRTIWITVGQGPTVLAVGASGLGGGGGVGHFTLICSFSPLSPSLWETARYRLKYCLKWPLNPKQPTNLMNGHNMYEEYTIFTFMVHLLKRHTTNHWANCSLHSNNYIGPHHFTTSNSKSFCQGFD